jgi:hypothetical protein
MLAPLVRVGVSKSRGVVFKACELPIKNEPDVADGAIALLGHFDLHDV